MGVPPLIACVAGLLLAGCAGTPADREDWQALFNGRNLDGWVPKIRGYPAGVDHANTFRVVNGVLTVSYDAYDDFGGRFGHLFYRQPHSHYRLRIEYRFVGEPAPGAPRWAWRNSGAMLHAQAPESMPPAQNFPISLEFQFLGGLGDGERRPTGNLCTPGTRVEYRGEADATHCIESTAATIEGDRWVLAEALVLGGDRIVHYIDGAEVIDYRNMSYGGGVVSGHDPAMKPDGEPIGSGHIALQSEGHAIEFRRVELLDLVGCTDPQARNYRSYYVRSEPAACRY